MIIIFQHILYWFGVKRNLKRKANRIEIDERTVLNDFPFFADYQKIVRQEEWEDQSTQQVPL